MNAPPIEATVLDAEHGFTAQQDDDPVPAEPVITYGTPSGHEVADGPW